MRNKKVLVIGTLLFVLCIACIFNAFAHSGRTDSSGGHWNRSTGTYHYHCGGYPAHSHSGGVCPYKTSSSSSKDKAKAALEKVNKEFGIKDNEYYDGYKEGYKKGRNEGYDYGYDRGYNYGYEDGIEKAVKITVIILIPILVIIIIIAIVKFIKKRRK